MQVQPEYHAKEYWDARYSDQGDDATFDWYYDYECIKEAIQQFLRFNSTILNIGCGNSSISESLYDDGYKRITNIDFSGVCIASMKNRNREARGDMTWLMCDPTQGTTFPENFFDFVFDKGCMDAIMCGKEYTEQAAKVVKEVARLLKPGAKYVVFSTGKPAERIPLFKNKEYNWKIQLKIVPKAAAQLLMKAEIEEFETKDAGEDDHGNVKMPAPEDEVGMMFIYVMTRLKASELANANKAGKLGSIRTRPAAKKGPLGGTGAMDSPAGTPRFAETPRAEATPPA